LPSSIKQVAEKGKMKESYCDEASTSHERKPHSRTSRSSLDSQEESSDRDNSKSSKEETPEFKTPTSPTPLQKSPSKKRTPVVTSHKESDTNFYESNHDKNFEVIQSMMRHSRSNTKDRECISYFADANIQTKPNKNIVSNRKVSNEVNCAKKHVNFPWKRFELQQYVPKPALHFKILMNWPTDDFNISH
jgi:hypothetical protein